jgi:3',5'-cyclic AMP phosphodiesterase CpdA
MEDRDEVKKYCRVCGLRVSRLYKRGGGRRCAVCLHRTHGRHLAGNRRVCRRCEEEELLIPAEYLQIPGSITMVHLTDLHFGGGSSPGRAALLKEWLGSRKPDYILVSGDLTGMARGEEYERAALWIRDAESAGCRVAVVPGNHDIGYWGNAASVAGQATGRKYHLWIKNIDRPIEPCVRGPGCVLLGLNSAHGINPSRIFNGYINRHQAARAVEIFKATPRGHLKVVFCHHPLVRFGDNRHRAMFRARSVREQLAGAGAGLFLWGHQHSFAAVDLSEGGNKCYAVQSPTLSDRVRDGDYPGFALIQWVFDDRVAVRTYNIVRDRHIEEDKRVEFTLPGGTTPPAVE